MPNIVQYNAPPDIALHPDDRAASTAREAGTVQNIFARETGQALGGAISRVGGQIGEQIDRHITAQQIGHGAAAYSSLYGDLTNQWNEVASKSDVNDTSIAQGFKEKVLEPSLQKFQKAFEGTTQRAQNWALTRTDEMRQHFSTKITADMGTRAGAAVHQNLNQMEINYSVTATNDPSSLPHISDAIKADVEAIISSHQLTAGDAARVRAQIVPKMQERIAQSAFDGMAQKNPQAALSALDHGDFNDYADGVTQAQWRKYAERQQSVQDADRKRDEFSQRQQFKLDSADKAEEYRSKMYDPHTGRILRTQPRLNQKILQDASLTTSDKTALIRWNHTQYEAQLREDKQAAAGATRAIGDPKVLDDLRGRIADDNSPTTRDQVNEALAADMITTKEAHDLVWRVGQADAAWNAVQRPFKQQFANFKHTMTNNIMSTVRYLDPQQQTDKFNKVEADAQLILRNAYKRGEDMRPYLDSASPKYVLKEAFHALTASPAAIIKEQADGARRAQGIIGGVNAGNEIKTAVERTGQAYEPNKYDYRIVNGQVQRKVKEAVPTTVGGIRG